MHGGCVEVAGMPGEKSRLNTEEASKAKTL